MQSSWGKGLGAEETKAAFSRVGELAVSAENASARFVAYEGQFVSSLMRGELCLARDQAEIFLREAETDGRATEAGVARRSLRVVLLELGEMKSARSVLERALADYIPERDEETQFRFGRDTEVGAASYLAVAEWHLGEVERARQLIDRGLRRADKLGSVAAAALALFWKVALEGHRQDVSATRQAADALLALAQEHGIRTYVDYGLIYGNWARGRLLDPEAGAVGLRQSLDAYIAQGNKFRLSYFHGLLAELEATVRGPDSALTLIDDALAIGEETGEHLSDAFLHRLRGDILLKGNPSDPAPAEEAYRTAIAITKEQGARSYHLQAALSLTRLYQSNGRPADAHAVLAPALEGFSPTPEMPEIAEAQTLLAAIEGGVHVRHEYPPHI